MSMKNPLCRLAAVLLLAVAGTGATAQEQAVAVAPGIRIYDAAELTLDRYTVVKRLWSGTWRGSFWPVSHKELDDAIEALKAAAADAGADGVVNLHCLSDDDWDGHYFCYGLAIRLITPPTFIRPTLEPSG